MAEHDLFLERALLEAKLINSDQLDRARRHARDQECSISEALVQCELLTQRDIALTRADISEVPFVNLADYDPCFANTALIPRNLAERYCAFPLFKVDNVLTIAMDDPLNLDATDQIRQITQCDVDPVLAEPELIGALVARAYSLTHNVGGPIRSDDEQFGSESDEAEASAPVVAAVNQLIADAIDERASDVHINPDEHELYVRYRVDGVLHKKQGPPLSMHAGLVQRLKVMSHLDLTQTRRPQDGKIRFRHANRQVDIRLSTLPTVCGENVVMRLLASNQSVGDFHALGMPAPMAAEFEELVSRPYGIFLVTGPTGSGKTTTLYSALAKLNEPSVNIMTIEDPVEIRLPYVRQVQVHSEIGMSFASALRSILRQDPDIVLVGEIRDQETATIALQAALTGHLVLSTLHTNDAAGAVSRLRDYGLPSFVINSAVLGVLAQRLVRRVCQHCVTPIDVDDIMRHRFNLPANAAGFVKGKGCGKCSQTGFRGRVGIYELLNFTNPIKQLIEQGESADRIRRAAVSHGMRLMWQDGLDKARLGQTTLEEVGSTASIIDLTDQAEPMQVKQAA